MIDMYFQEQPIKYNKTITYNFFAAVCLFI